MNANNRQIGGDHYIAPIQHWDYVWANKLDYFQAQIIKYVTRFKKKNGLEDLAKARHFLEKYMELQQDNGAEPDGSYTNQDPDQHNYPDLRKYCNCDEPEYAKDDEIHEHCTKCGKDSIF